MPQPPNDRWSPPAIELSAERRSELLRLIAQLDEAMANPELADAKSFLSDLSEKRRLLVKYERAAAALQTGGVSVVFVAPKGAGKSSVLNGLLRTWAAPLDVKVDDEETSGDRLQRCAVLPLGAGGTTPCEVHFLHHDDWSVRVEREDEATVRIRIDGLAGWAYRKAASKSKASPQGGTTGEILDDAEGEPVEPVAAAKTEHDKILLQPVLESDVARCLIGVCGLKQASLLNLAATFVARPEGAALLRDELLRMLGYEDRQECEIFPDGSTPLAWLKTVLEQLTWGSWPKQPFPLRIIVQGPLFPRLGLGAQPLRLVDSLGLPAVSKNPQDEPMKGRKDLRDLLEADWALPVFVAGYTNPPEPIGAAIKYAFAGEAPLAPHSRAVVPLLYKGEPVPPDPTKSKKEIKITDAANKQELAVGNINQTLGTLVKQQDWHAAQSPVIDLLGTMGAENSIVSLDTALSARLVGMQEEWHTRTQKEVDDARKLVSLAANAAAKIKQTSDALCARLSVPRGQFRASVQPLRDCPILAFAVACNGRPYGGYLHWATVYSVGRNHGRGTRNAFALLHDDVKKHYLEVAARDWTIGAQRAHLELTKGADALTSALLESGINAELERVKHLAATLPKAFEHAFEVVADQASGGSGCPWEGRGGSIVGVREAGQKPLGPNWHAGLVAWGRRNQAALWAEIEGYLRREGVELPS